MIRYIIRNGEKILQYKCIEQIFEPNPLGEGMMLVTVEVWKDVPIEIE